MAVGMIYRGDDKSLFCRDDLKNAYLYGSDEDMQDAVSNFYKEKDSKHYLPERANSHDKFMQQLKKKPAMPTVRDVLQNDATRVYNPISNSRTYKYVYKPYPSDIIDGGQLPEVVITAPKLHANGGKVSQTLQQTFPLQTSGFKINPEITSAKTSDRAPSPAKQGFSFNGTDYVTLIRRNKLYQKLQSFRQSWLHGLHDYKHDK